MTNKLSKKFTAKTVALAVAALTMSGVMVYDAIDVSPPATPVSSLESDVFEPLPLSEPESLQALPVAVDTDAAPLVTDTLENTPQVEVAQAATHVVIRYEMALPESTMQALTAIEDEYRATLKHNANLAKINAQSSNKTLEDGSPKAQPKEKKKAEEKQPAVMGAADQVSLLALKSIVSSPSHKSAWFERQGQLFPVKEGAWIGDVKVHRITQTMVLFIDKLGKTHQKHMPTRKIVKPKKVVVNG